MHAVALPLTHNATGRNATQRNATRAGSTIDAMSDAVDGADVMLYGVSLPYKESGNCRLEANYA
jgi:hypothetical protein